MLHIKIYYALRPVVKLAMGQLAPPAVNTAGSNCMRMEDLKPYTIPRTLVWYAQPHSMGAPTSPGKLYDAGTLCRSPYPGFSIWWSCTFGTTVECHVMVRAGGTAVYPLNWRFVHQYCSLCLWHEHIQGMDVCLQFFGTSPFGMHLSAPSKLSCSSPRPTG